MPLSLSFSRIWFYIDCGDKWLRSFDDTLLRLSGRLNGEGPAVMLPFFMAFFTASVSEENEATVWIGLFEIDELLVGRSASVAADFFDGSRIFANGVQRLVGLLVSTGWLATTIDLEWYFPIDRSFVLLSCCSAKIESFRCAWLVKWTLNENVNGDKRKEIDALTDRNRICPVHSDWEESQNLFHSPASSLWSWSLRIE